MSAALSTRTPIELRHASPLDLEALSLAWQAENDPRYSTLGPRALKRLRSDEYRKSRAGSISATGRYASEALLLDEDALPAPDDYAFTDELPDIFDQYRSTLAALRTVILARFRTVKSRAAVGLMIRPTPIYRIAKMVGLSARQVYNLRKKLCAILPALIESKALPLFDHVAVDLHFAGGPARPAKTTKSRKFVLTINNQPVLL